MAALGTAAPSAEAHPPPFYWMGDISGDSRVGVSLLAGTTEQVTDDAIVIGGDVFAEIQVSDTIAILGRVPFTYADYELFLVDEVLTIEESAAALGNISLGAQFSSIGQLGEYMSTRLGGGFLVALPTANSENEAGLASAITAAFFLPDPGRYLPNTTSIRLRGDVRAESDLVFFQGELALDVHMVEDGDDPKELVLGAGLGFMLSPYFALLTELTTRADVLDDNDDRGESFLHVLDAGFRYHDGNVMAGFRVYLPLDESLRSAEVLGFGADIAARF